MKFWQSFSKKAILKQLIFVLVLFAILIPIAFWDSNTQVKVNFNRDSLDIYSDRYNMNIPYELIDSAELADLAEPGEKVAEGWDDDIIRTGKWVNSDWGEYYIVADLDTTNCVLVHLTDGRLFVFSCKDNKTTETHFETLQTHLS